MSRRKLISPVAVGSLLIELSDMQDLEAIAEMMQVKKPELIRLAIKQFIKQYKSRVNQLSK